MEMDIRRAAEKQTAEAFGMDLLETGYPYGVRERAKFGQDCPSSIGEFCTSL